MITTIAGMSIGITASSPASQTMASYGALTYSNIGYLSDAGEHGIEYEVVEFKPITTRAVIKLKGGFDYGNKTIEVAYDPTDSGTSVLRDAVNTFGEYAFRVAYNDSVIEYFSAKVKNFTKATGTVNSMRMLSVTLNVTQLLDTEDSANVGYLLSDLNRILANSGGDLLITA